MATKRSFKRPFRPSINSYLGLVRDTDCHQGPTQTIIPNPLLPSTIQSSLLNVGMRVRKSVSDGYKIRQKLICDISIPLTGSSSRTALPGSASKSFNGLVQYCGILKVGGYDVQEPIPGEADIPPLQFDQDDWNLLSSQESNTSTIFTNPMNLPQSISPVTTNNNNKRRREDADEVDLDLEAQPVSPRSRPISHTRMPNLNHIRPIALGKSRKKASQAEDIRESEMIDVEDFEEAQLLSPQDWADGGGTSVGSEGTYFPI